METVFENLTRHELLQLVYSCENTISIQEKEVVNYQQENDYLRQQVAMLKRMQFGQKRERFEAESNQMSLPFEAPGEEVEKQENVVGQKIEYTRKACTHKGRAKLPEHLPVEEIEIHPAGDLTDMVCIGKEVTEELECEPARFFIKRYIRFKYAPKNGEGVLIGALPERVIDKGIAGAGLLATIITDKYMDHLPLYRQKQRFARENIQIAASTIDGWTKETLLKLEPLYDQLLFDTQSKGYLQVDETPIKVMDSDKKGATHQGYYWVYHAPLEGTVLFDYSPTRGSSAPLLKAQIIKSKPNFLTYTHHGIVSLF